MTKWPKKRKSRRYAKLLHGHLFDICLHACIFILFSSIRSHRRIGHSLHDPEDSFSSAFKQVKRHTIHRLVKPTHPSRNICHCSLFLRHLKVLETTGHAGNIDAKLPQTLRSRNKARLNSRKDSIACSCRGIHERYNFLRNPNFSSIFLEEKCFVRHKLKVRCYVRFFLHLFSPSDESMMCNSASTVRQGTCFSDNA